MHKATTTGRMSAHIALVLLGAGVPFLAASATARAQVPREVSQARSNAMKDPTQGKALVAYEKACGTIGYKVNASQIASSKAPSVSVTGKVKDWVKAFDQWGGARFAAVSLEKKVPELTKLEAVKKHRADCLVAFDGAWANGVTNMGDMTKKKSERLVGFMARKPADSEKLIQQVAEMGTECDDVIKEISSWPLSDAQKQDVAQVCDGVKKEVATLKKKGEEAQRAAMEKRICPAGEARDKKIEAAIKKVHAAREESKDEVVKHVRLRAPLQTEPKGGVLEQWAFYHVCGVNKKAAEEPKCFIGSYGAKRFKSGNKWTKWEWASISGYDRMLCKNLDKK